MSIFISYRRKLSSSFAIALKYAFDLHTGDVSTMFLDQRNLHEGESYPDELKSELDKCKIFVPIIQGNYLSEIVRRDTKNSSDWVYDELQTIYQRIQEKNEKVEVRPIRISDDFKLESLENLKFSDHEDNSKTVKKSEVLRYFAERQTAFCFGAEPNVYIIDSIIQRLFLKYKKLSDKEGLNPDILNFIKALKSEKPVGAKKTYLKILFIGPTALYSLRHLDLISDEIIGRFKRNPTGISQNERWIKNSITNNLLKCCEYFLQTYKEDNKYQQLSIILNRDTHCNLKLIKRIKEAYQHFDIIVNFSPIMNKLFQGVPSEELFKLSLNHQPKVQDDTYVNRLREKIKDVENKRINKLFIQLQKITKNPKSPLQYPLFTINDYLIFIKDTFKKLDALNARTIQDNTISLFTGIGEIDLILKNLFLETNSISVSDEEEFNAEETIKPRALLYGYDFDIMYPGFYEGKSFVVEQMPLEEFLSHLLN